MDADGDMDLIVGNWEQANVLLINDGSGGFTSSASFPGGSKKTTALATGDVDGDGDIDVVVGNYDDGDVLLINNGASGFSSMDGFPGGSTSSITLALALGDVDAGGSPGTQTPIGPADCGLAPHMLRLAVQMATLSY